MSLIKYLEINITEVTEIKLSIEILRWKQHWVSCKEENSSYTSKELDKIYIRQSESTSLRSRCALCTSWNDSLTTLGDVNQWINLRQSQTEGQTAGISLGLQKASIVKGNRKICYKSKDIKGICSSGQVENTQNKTCPINGNFPGFDTCTIIT